MPVYDKAIRILIHHVGINCRALYRRHITMNLGPGRALPSPAPGHGLPGFWVELRDDADRTLYWKILWRPFSHTIETVTATGRLGHQAHASPQGTFDVIVPDIQAAHQVVLFASPLDVDDDLKPAAEVFRSEIDPIRKVS